MSGISEPAYSNGPAIRSKVFQFPDESIKRPEIQIVLVDFDVWDFIAKKLPVEKSLPLLCVLTISATGSEMDNTAVLNNSATQYKLALINDKLFPAASFCI